MVSLPNRLLLATSLVTALLSVPPAAAQAQFLPLGVDPTGDAELSGVPMLDTWIDINGLGVATVDGTLVFHLGLEGTTTEAGQYCWMAAFEFDGTEYVGLDCYEGIAYESDNTVSGVRPASTSRGTNVASDVSFDDTGAVITIPLSAFGASVGDVIEDVYGLTYATRALSAVDTVPDAKMSADADESLGSYRIGGGSLGDAPATIEETLAAPAFAHDFANATSATYVLNATVPWANASAAINASVQSGSANVTFLRNGTALHTFEVSNATGNGTGNLTTVQAIGNATGNWSIVVVYDAFVGRLSVNVTEDVPAVTTTTTSTSRSGSFAPASGNTTTAAGDDEEEAPAPGVALLLVALAAVALVRRRK